MEENEEIKLQKLYRSIQQSYVFSENACKDIEKHIEEVIQTAESGAYKQFTTDEMPLRKKYFFGQGYTYGSRQSRRGPGKERVYPEGFIDPIPHWMSYKVIHPLVKANIIPADFVNSVVVNNYQPGGCIVSHVDPPHIFDRPIVSLSLFSDSVLSFGCKFDFKPIRCSEPILKLPLPRGIVTLITGYAANCVTHCIRPEDTKHRRAAIVLRRVFPEAPRLCAYELSLKMNRKLDDGALFKNLIPCQLKKNLFSHFNNCKCASY